jgi:ABC-type multidrug transport system ATPase subunit
MSILTGKTKASSGSAEYLHPTSSPIGVVPQKNVLIDELTCIETIQLFCTLKGVQRSDVNQAAEQLLVDVGLSEKRDALVNSLSGGMKRKLQLSLGLAGNSDCMSFLNRVPRLMLTHALPRYIHRRGGPNAFVYALFLLETSAHPVLTR